MGTPHYMAPEQMEKPETVDHRADIFSLGVLFYEMLTGELPLGRFPPPSNKVQIDLRIDEVVLRALEKEPERRFQKASEVRYQVESITERPTRAAPRPAADRTPAPPDTPAFPLGILLACALILKSSFLPWVTMRGHDATAWSSTLALGEMDFPNRLVLLAAAAIAVLAWLRWRGQDVPHALIPVLAVYGLAHTALLAVVVWENGDAKPQLSHFLSLAGFVAVLAGYRLRPAARLVVPTSSQSHRQQVRRWLHLPASTLMTLGVLGCVFWGSILFIAIRLYLEEASRFGGGRVHSVPAIFPMIILGQFILSWLVAWGAGHMVRLDRYDLANATPVLALFPAGPLGWPFAFWARWALRQPGVPDAFRSPPRTVAD
jgi:hypothetical protein